MAIRTLTDFHTIQIAGVVNADGVSIGATPSDIKGVTKATQDLLMDNGKGPVLKSPNGHRMRLVFSNLGVASGFDLDA